MSNQQADFAASQWSYYDWADLYASLAPFDIDIQVDATQPNPSASSLTFIPSVLRAPSSEPSERPASGSWAGRLSASRPGTPPISNITYSPVPSSKASRLIDNFVLRSTGHVPRVPNSFICFRRDFVKHHKADDSQPKLQQKDLSKLASEVWHNMSDDERQPYVRASEQLKARFNAEHPDYKYQPMQRRSKEEYRLGRKLWNRRRQQPGCLHVLDDDLNDRSERPQVTNSLAPPSVIIRPSSCPPFLPSPVKNVPFITQMSKRSSEEAAPAPPEAPLRDFDLFDGFAFDDWIVDY